MANLALLGDKNLLFNADRTAFIMYQASGSSWVSMGDPVGPTALHEPLVWTFIENCDGMAVSPVFYQVTPDNLPLYIDLGLTLSKLGEEARVPLDTFSPGRRRARGPAPFASPGTARRRRIRSGERARISAASWRNCAQVSDAWLAAKNTAEKRFSLGYFDERYLAHFDCAVVRRAGAIVAFANIWRAGADTQLSVDLMRYNDAAPKGVIDFLLAECMLWGKAQHYQWFSLGMAPLSGLEEHALAPTWHKLGRMVQRYGETFYPFEGPAKVQGEIRAGLAPSLSRRARRVRHGSRVAGRDIAHFGRRQQGIDQVIRIGGRAPRAGDRLGARKRARPAPFAVPVPQTWACSATIRPHI